jgi:predicted ATP-grasp superfamily ATP-dependent carboligase
LNIDTKPLIEASKQIEKRFSTLIKTAQETMDKQPEIPGYPTMYG